MVGVGVELDVGAATGGEVADDIPANTAPVLRRTNATESAAPSTRRGWRAKTPEDTEAAAAGTSRSASRESVTPQCYASVGLPVSTRTEHSWLMSALERTNHNRWNKWSRLRESNS